MTLKQLFAANDPSVLAIRGQIEHFKKILVPAFMDETAMLTRRLGIIIIER